MSAIKETHHPNAYLTVIRNVKRGLKARTSILNSLEDHSAGAKTLVQEAILPYSVVMHHLKLLRSEGIVERKGTKPYQWLLTGRGQKRLTNPG